jgi:hypothetical protein
MPSLAATLPRPFHDPAMALRSRFQKGIFVAWQGNGMVCVDQTRPHCVNQIGKTQYKALAERHGNGMVCVNQPIMVVEFLDLLSGYKLLEKDFAVRTYK